MAAGKSDNLEVIQYQPTVDKTKRKKNVKRNNFNLT